MQQHPNKCEALDAIPPLHTIYEIVKFELKYFDWFSKVKRAYVLPEKIQKSFMRYGSLLLNRGFKSQLFNNADEATAWLSLR